MLRKLLRTAPGALLAHAARLASIPYSATVSTPRSSLSKRSDGTRLAVHAASTQSTAAPRNATRNAVSTRLITRERFAYTHRWSPLLVEPVSAASSFMSQKMLRCIRDRAERAAMA